MVGSANHRLLLIEDDPGMSQVLSRGLALTGYDVQTASTMRYAEQFLVAGSYDAVILDLMLPDGDGVEFCRSMRHRGLITPVLVLTALDRPEERIGSLDAGADDHLSKPFEFDELCARLRALIRRNAAQTWTPLAYADLELDLRKKTARRGNRSITLTRREFELLAQFLRNPHRVLDREQLVERLAQTEPDCDVSAVTTCVMQLRRKLDPAGTVSLLHTVPGVGFILSADGPPA